MISITKRNRVTNKDKNTEMCMTIEEEGWFNRRKYQNSVREDST